MERKANIQIPASIESFRFSDELVEALVPDASLIQDDYEQSIAAGNNPAFPYWAQVWPAAKALCEMIAGYPNLVKDKVVLELAAGIGLPSLLAARFAKSVTASDYIPAAVELMQRSVQYSDIENMNAVVLDWNNLDDSVSADVLLLSDINYDPASFEVLYMVLQRFLEKGTTILLSTPQRIQGRAFMAMLEPWCRNKEEITIMYNGSNVYTSVWILKK